MATALLAPFMFIVCPVPVHRNGRSFMIFHKFLAPPPIPSTTGGSKMKSKSFFKKIVRRSVE